MGLFVILLIVTLVVTLIVIFCIGLFCCCAGIVEHFPPEDEDPEAQNSPPTAANKHELTWKQKLHYICCVLACPPCPGNIIAKLAFHPPKPPTYTFEPDPRNPIQQRIVVPKESAFVRSMQGRLQAFFVDVSGGNRLACLFFSPFPLYRYVILHSHGNAMDMGQMVKSYHNLAVTLRCSLVAWDYRGYGASTGTMTESHLYADILAVAKALKDHLGIKPEQCILYGQSIGSVPTMHLASQGSFRPAGVVIVAGVLSGLDTACPERPKLTQWVPTCCNPFYSKKKVARIKCPVLIVHGKNDKVVPFALAKEMHKLCPTAVEPLWLEAGHNNVENDEFIERLTRFKTSELDESIGGSQTTATASTVTADSHSSF